MSGKNFIVSVKEVAAVLCECISVFCCRVVHSSAYDKDRKMKVAIKKLARPFQTAIHAKRAYRELRLLRHMHHENVTAVVCSFGANIGLFIHHIVNVKQ